MAGLKWSIEQRDEKDMPSTPVVADNKSPAKRVKAESPRDQSPHRARAESEDSVIITKVFIDLTNSPDDNPAPTTPAMENSRADLEASPLATLTPLTPQIRKFSPRGFRIVRNQSKFLQKITEDPIDKTPSKEVDTDKSTLLSPYDDKAFKCHLIDDKQIGALRPATASSPPESHFPNSHPAIILFPKISRVWDPVDTFATRLEQRANQTVTGSKATVKRSLSPQTPARQVMRPVKKIRSV